ncbi:MAG: zinc ribbon domain-containing protein [Clostridia bacterium]|nr:zinc ribbon domain-containing protein [Clostridia bacterium]
MAYCYYCGQELGAKDRYCPRCGKPIVVDRGPELSEDASAGERIRHSVRSVLSTTDHTPEFSSQDIEEGRGFSLFAYLGVLILVPVFAARGSRFARFHIGQGINLMLALLVYSAAMAIGYALVSWIPLFGNFFEALYDIGEAFGILAFLALAAVGIGNTNNGKAKELPLIGQVTLFRY